MSPLSVSYSGFPTRIRFSQMHVSHELSAFDCEKKQRVIVFHRSVANNNIKSIEENTFKNLTNLRKM